MNIFDFYKKEFKSGKVAIIKYNRHYEDQFFCATDYVGLLATALTIIKAEVEENQIKLPAGPEPKYNPSMSLKDIQNLPENIQREMKILIEREEKVHAGDYMAWKYISEIERILKEKDSIAALKFIQLSPSGLIRIEFVKPNV